MNRSGRILVALAFACTATFSSLAFGQPESLTAYDAGSKAEVSIDVQGASNQPQTVDALLAGREEALSVSPEAYAKMREYRRSVGTPNGAPRDPSGDIYNTDLAIDEAFDAPGDGPVSVHAAFNNLTFGAPNPEQNGQFLDLGGLEGILDGQIHDVTDVATDLGNGVFRLNITYQLRLPSPFPSNELFPGGLTVGNGGLTDGFIFFGDVEPLDNLAGQTVLSYTIDLFDRMDNNVGAFDAFGTLADNNAPWDGEASVLLPGVAGDDVSRIEIEMIIATLDQVDPTGACCLIGLDCVDGVTALQCAGGGGVYQGDASTCATSDCTLVPGACCDTRDGTCVDGVDVATCAPTVRDAFFARFLSANAVCADFDPPCAATAFTLACDVNDIVEGETCSTADEFNSGCFSDLDPVNGAFNGPVLTSGDTVCGISGTNFDPSSGTTFNDLDHYEFNLVDIETQVIFSFEAEFDALIGIVNTAGSVGCPPAGGTGALAPFFPGTGTLVTAGNQATIQACLPAGTWYFIVGTDLNSAPQPCTADLTYRLTYDAFTPCITIECPVGSNGLTPNAIGNGPDGITFATSDRAIGFSVAESFTPAAASMVTEVTWWGAYFDTGFAVCPDGAMGTPMDDDWEITYYINDDLNNLPGNLLAGPFSVTATETPTGRIIGGDAEVEFTATHPPVAVTAGNCHWVEISNNTTGCFFAMSTAPPGDGLSAQRNLPADFVVGDASNFDLGVCWNIGLQAISCPDSIDFQGACCLPFGPCQVLTLSNCLGQDGIFAGVDTVCGVDTDCTGACCVPDTMAGTASCQILTYQQCVTVSTNGNNIFEFLGLGTDCADSPCATGNCCFADGSCQDFANSFVVTHRPNCQPQLISDEPGNIFDRLNTFTAPPFLAVGGFTEGGACTIGFGDPVCPQPSVFNALDVGCNGSATLNNAGLGVAGNSSNGTIDQPDMSCFGGGPAAEGNGAFWLTFEASNLQTLVSTCSTTAVNDTVLSVYTSTGLNPANDIFNNGEAFEVACNEDAVPNCNGDGGNFNAEVCLDTVPGQRYWVQVASFDVASQGEITTTITCADDVCDAAAPCATCTSDVDGDNDRDGADIQAFANELISPTPNLCADTDGSGTIDLGDIANFVSEVLAGGTCP